MGIAAFHNLNPVEASTLQARVAPQLGAFTRVLASKTSQEQVREAAQQLVASAFIQPVLEQMRDDPFKSELFHGGLGEDMFAQQLDTVIADRIATRQNMPLVEAVYRHIQKMTTGGKAAPPKDALNVHG